MPTIGEPSPLAVAALALVHEHVTPTELASRFAEADATLGEGTTERLLDELCDLGLARAVHGSSGSAQYFPTPLGERLLRLSFVGRREHAELLGELEQMRTDFLSTISHELRTPLTAVRTSVGLLRDPGIEASPDERRSMLETIDRNASRMQRVVADILDLARFRVGHVQLQLRRFDAVELARSAIASVDALAGERGQRIDLDEPAEPIRVFADYRRLEQALVNLLSNAEKYSPDGARISVSVQSSEQRVRWTVSDTGRGIRPEDKARLFERFFVAGRDSSGSATGIGLGLPITLAIVQAHEGRIEVDSRVGHGSTFTIVVPADGPSEAPDE